MGVPRGQFGIEPLEAGSFVILLSLLCHCPNRSLHPSESSHSLFKERVIKIDMQMYPLQRHSPAKEIRANIKAIRLWTQYH